MSIAFRARDLAPVFLAAAIFACVSFATGCGDGQRGRPNLLLITLDTTRADRLGCYGYEAARTPTLDGLAETGILFEHAYTPYPLTLPSHTSMLTGLLPFRHEVRNNDVLLRPDAPRTVAQRLQDGGYRTAAVVSSFVLERRFGLARGFESYEDRFAPEDSPPGATSLQRRAGRTTDVALAALGGITDAPFFLWIHYFDPHSPYDPPDDFDGEGYDGEIAYLDREIGRLCDGLRKLDVWDNTAVLVVGDHGEAFGERGEREHGLFLYDTTLRVPMILRLPEDERAGERAPGPVSVADAAPTLLGLAGLESSFPHSVDLGTDRAAPERRLYAETLSPYFNYRAAPLSSLRTEGWKYISAPRPELYDLGEDPDELRDRAEAEPGRAGMLRDELDAFCPRDVAVTRFSGETTATDRETRERLAALGYASTPATGRVGTGRTDPKDLIAVQGFIEAADRALAAGTVPDAVRAYENALAADPGNWKATWKLANVLEKVGELDAAVGWYREHLERDPTNSTGYYNLALLLRRGGRSAEALEALSATIEVAPHHAKAWSRRGLLQLEAGRKEEARRDLETALRINPGDAVARQGLESL